MKILRDITYGNEPGQVIDAFLPDGGEETRALFLYFHGGGLAGGSRRGAEKKLAPLLTSSGIALASADYRIPVRSTRITSRMPRRRRRSA